MKFSRLELLDNPKYKDTEEVEEIEKLPLPRKIDLGQFHITQHSVMMNRKEKIPKARALFMIFTKDPSPFVATLHDSSEKVSISIWNMLEDKIHLTIKSELITYKVCLESAQNDRQFSMTSNQFSMLSEFDKDHGQIDFHKWSFDLSKPSTKNSATKESLIVDLNVEQNEKSGLSTSLYLMTTEKFHIIQVKECQEWLVDKSCTFIVLDALAKQPTVLRRLSMPAMSSGKLFLTLFLKYSLSLTFS